MPPQPWYLRSDAQLPMVFPDRDSLAKILPYRGRWLLLSSGGVYRGEEPDDPPLYADAYYTFSAEEIEGHFHVVPTALLVQAAGETALLLSALLSLTASGNRYLAYLDEYTVRVTTVNVKANELVRFRMWLDSEPTFAGPAEAPTKICGTVKGRVTVLRHGQTDTTEELVFPIEEAWHFQAYPKHHAQNPTG